MTTKERAARPSGTAIEYVERELAHDPALRRDVEETLTEMRLIQDLVALRQQRGLTQVQFAQLLGITQPRIAKLESGTMTNLELRTIVRMATALGARVRVLLEVDDQAIREAVGMSSETTRKRVRRLKEKLKGRKLTKA